jgi:hypothetical protein
MNENKLCLFIVWHESTIKALTHRKWTNKSTSHKQCQRQPSIELPETQADNDKQDPTHLAKLKPAFIIFEDTISHVSNKDQHVKMPFHHGMHYYRLIYHYRHFHCHSDRSDGVILPPPVGPIARPPKEGNY